MASITNSIWDIIGAFVAAEESEFLGPNRQWQPQNMDATDQIEFIAFLQRLRSYAPQLVGEGLLESKISWIAEEINNWFDQRGFTIRLTPDGNPDTFYVGSIYEQLIHWLIPGEQEPLTAHNQQLYEGVLLEDGVYCGMWTENRQLVASIVTKNQGDVAFMTMLDVVPEGPFALLELAHLIERNLAPAYDYGSVHFPMVHINNQVDVAWLKGLRTVSERGQPAKVSQAVQQTILKVNHLGALAKSAFGMAVTLELAMAPRSTMLIDRPFLFWISREGYPLPLFAAWIDYDDWKNPGDLT